MFSVTSDNSDKAENNILNFEELKSITAGQLFHDLILKFRIRPN
jgi:hypothetical protein